MLSLLALAGLGSGPGPTALVGVHPLTMEREVVLRDHPLIVEGDRIVAERK